jgi:uncharacterized protein (TIGR02145 family)
MGSKSGFIKAVAVPAALVALCLTGCGKGDVGTSASKKPEQASGTGGETSETLLDSRDGQKYRTVKIGDKTWMAENLKHKTSVRECYNNDDSKCAQYGELYGWARAITSCPAGWHLPSSDEWGDLGQAVGGEKRLDENGNADWHGVATKLKTKSGWESDGNKDGNGTDEHGFSALPGGGRIPNFDSDFGGIGVCGYWWTSTERDGDAAYRWGICQNEILTERSNSKSLGFSVRCVKD